MSPLRCALAIFCLLPLAARAGETQILKWKDGKKAVFMLAFDDSAPSQLQNVVPELEKRKIFGTFYLVTGNGVWAGTKAKWAQAAKSPYVVIANHTFTHKGINSAAELEPEMQQCNDVLYALRPDLPKPRLIAFGTPGGVPWNATKEEVLAVQEKLHLVQRPPFFGPPIHLKSAAECVARVDQTLAKGDMTELVFHGVGGDWLTTPLEWFTALLDKLEAHRDQLWLADTASWAKYVKERDTAELKPLESSAQKIRLSLTTKADPVIYDLPLTLSTKVPPGWKSCRVAQGSSTQTVPVQSGVAQYDARPGTEEIILTPAE